MCELTNQNRLSIREEGILKETGAKTVFQTEGDKSAAALKNEKTDVFFEH